MTFSHVLVLTPSSSTAVPASLSLSSPHFRPCCRPSSPSSSSPLPAFDGWTGTTIVCLRLCLLVWGNIFTIQETMTEQQTRAPCWYTTHATRTWTFLPLRPHSTVVARRLTTWCRLLERKAPILASTSCGNRPVAKLNEEKFSVSGRFDLMCQFVWILKTALFCSCCSYSCSFSCSISSSLVHSSSSGGVMAISLSV